MLECGHTAGIYVQTQSGTHIVTDNVAFLRSDPVISTTAMVQQQQRRALADEQLCSVCASPTGPSLAPGLTWPMQAKISRQLDQSCAGPAPTQRLGESPVRAWAKGA